MIHALLVDDHPTIRRVLRRFLEFSGLVEVIAEAEDGEQALRYVHQLRPDILILDLTIPPQDGFAVLEALRRLPAPPKVVVLSAYDSNAIKARAIAAGASAFVSKDTAHINLLPTIRAIVDP